jgi:hypothetical protein
MDVVQRITFWIAVYGAFIGTVGTVISGILGYYELHRDERQILMLVDLAMAQASGKLFITNDGHRPITLTEISILVVRVAGRKRKTGETMFLTTGQIETDKGKDYLPKTMTDGEVLGIPLREGFTRSLEELGGTLVIIVRDSAGREYVKYKKGRNWDLLHSH